MSNEFYVYIHRKKSNNDVFYVGKGKGKRAYDTSSRSEYWKRVYLKHGRIVEIIESGLSECDAFELEKEMIIFYRNNGYKLANLTDGGEGAKWSDIAKQSLKDVWISRKQQFEERPPELDGKLSLHHRRFCSKRMRTTRLRALQLVVGNLLKIDKIRVSFSKSATGKVGNSKVSCDSVRKVCEWLSNNNIIKLHKTKACEITSGGYSYIETIEGVDIVKSVKELITSDPWLYG